VGKEWARLEVWKTSLAPLKWKKVRYAYGSRASSRGNHRLMWLNHEVFTTNPTSAWIQRAFPVTIWGLKRGGEEILEFC